MEDDLRKLKKRRDSDSDSDSDSRRKRRAGPSVLEQELAKYSKNKGRAAKQGNKRGRRGEEEDLLKEMSKFSQKVAATVDDEDADEEPDRPDGQLDPDNLEVDDDVRWMKHSLRFVVDEKELTRRAEDEYAVSNAPVCTRHATDQLLPR